MVISLGWLSTAFAGAFYIAPMLVYESIKSNETISPPSDKLITFQGLAPQISAGYGDWNFFPFYLAGELFVIPVKPLTIHNVTNTTSGGSVRPGWTAGISALFGANLDGYIKFYARVSALYTYFDVVNQTKSGFQVGPGLEWILNNNWSLRGEYILTYYRSTSAGTPSAQQGGLGIVYYFTC